MLFVLISFLQLNITFSSYFSQIDVSKNQWSKFFTQRKLNFTFSTQITKLYSMPFILIELFINEEYQDANLLIAQSFQYPPYIEVGELGKSLVCDNADQIGHMLNKGYHYILLEKPQIDQFKNYLTIITNKTVTYSLIITSYQDKPCPRNCSNNGFCNAGICQCSENYVDIDCSQQATLLNYNSTYNKTMQLKQNLYFYFPYNNSQPQSLLIQYINLESNQEPIQLLLLGSKKKLLPCYKLNHFNKKILNLQTLNIYQNKFSFLNITDEYHIVIVFKIDTPAFISINVTLLNEEQNILVNNYFNILIIALIIIIMILIIKSIQWYCKKSNQNVFLQIPNNVEFDELNEDEKICVICLDVIDKIKECREISTCHHIFHKQCIQLWLKLQINCPICKQ